MLTQKRWSTIFTVWATVLLAVLLFSLASIAFAEEPNWTRDVKIPLGQNRANIYNSNLVELSRQVIEGKRHALVYPVDNTKLLIPHQALKDFFAMDENNPLKKVVLELTKGKINIKSEKEFYQWIGLSPFPDFARFPELNPFSPFFVPAADLTQMQHGLPMGAGLVKAPQGEGLTFSCAGCHSYNFFGRPIMGMANKRPRANDFFLLGKKYMPFIPTAAFALGTGATREEIEVFQTTKKFVRATGGKNPQTLGLDTSLAQLALSLAHRNNDPWALHSLRYEIKPRSNMLDEHIADSKPLPWWNVKYKTRWLADGSVVSGNPIFTNILWNEIGRGADLKELSEWLQKNEQKLHQLTAAVFASEAPHWLDYFPDNSIDERLAKQGEVIFNNACMKCHGSYEKGWSKPYAPALPKRQRLETTRVVYHEQTPVKNVGTDPDRYLGTKAFAQQLNNLEISKQFGTVVEPQEGYVPPPLVGIWARFPYLHNNSVPSLCAILEVAAKRPSKFYQGPSVTLATDYDASCVGYPTGEKIPENWKSAEALVDTAREGMRNIGHEKMLLNDQGLDRFSPEQKRALIEFLKTL